MRKILVVEDEDAIREVVALNLRLAGYEVTEAASAEQALAVFSPPAGFDVAVLDIMLPGMNGIDVCKAIRETSTVPIVMLTARTDTVDVVLGLESGADDYVHKPFKPKELVARVRGRLLRTPEEAPADTIEVADLKIDVPGHQVIRDGQEIALTPIEFDLLVTLASRPRQVFSREELLEQVWGYRKSSDTRLVNVHIQRLRSKVEKDPDDPKIIQTVRGIGYKTGE